MEKEIAEVSIGLLTWQILLFVFILGGAYLVVSLYRRLMKYLGLKIKKIEREFKE